MNGFQLLFLDHEATEAETNTRYKIRFKDRTTGDYITWRGFDDRNEADQYMKTLPWYLLQEAELNRVGDPKIWIEDTMTNQL